MVLRHSDTAGSKRLLVFRGGLSPDWVHQMEAPCLQSHRSLLPHSGRRHLTWRQTVWCHLTPRHLRLAEKRPYKEGSSSWLLLQTSLRPRLPDCHLDRSTRAAVLTKTGSKHACVPGPQTSLHGPLDPL